MPNTMPQGARQRARWPVESLWGRRGARARKAGQAGVSLRAPRVRGRPRRGPDDNKKGAEPATKPNQKVREPIRGHINI